MDWSIYLRRFVKAGKTGKKSWRRVSTAYKQAVNFSKVNRIA
jgi:hypothetical protein